MFGAFIICSATEVGACRRGTCKQEMVERSLSPARNALFYNSIMGVAEILHEIETLPAEERWEVLEHTRQLLEPEIPESFKQAMDEIKRGDVIELDDALQELE